MEWFYKIMQQRHPLPGGQRLPTLEETVVCACKGLGTCVSRMFGYGGGSGGEYKKAEDPAKAANTAYLMFSTRSRT